MAMDWGQWDMTAGSQPGVDEAMGMLLSRDYVQGQLSYTDLGYMHVSILRIAIVLVHTPFCSTAYIHFLQERM